MSRRSRMPVRAFGVWIKQLRFRGRTWYRRRRELRQIAHVTRGAPRARRWHVRWPLRVLPITLGVLLLGWVGWSLAMLIVRPEDAGFNPDRICEGYGMYCGAVINFLMPALTVGLAFIGFLTYRYTWVRQWYQNKVRHRPRAVVPTAGRLIEDVVGRDQLCEVIMENLRVPDTRRTHVLVGSIGTGKTATLVRLAQSLARRNVVPIALRLRDVAREEDLDFRTLAQKRLKSLLDDRLRYDGEADKIWRQLCRDHRIVVLADGLEEALVDQVDDRDSALRLAIWRAAEQKLPLVIASRPHDPLRGTDAIVTELEPLGEGPALEYVTRDSGQERQDWQQLVWLVQGVEVAYAPLYLQIIRDLDHAGRLAQVPVSNARESLDSLASDRARLRRELLDAWRIAVVEGHLYEDYALDESHRAAAIEVLSALACIGLKLGSMGIKFKDLIGTARAQPGATGAPGAPRLEWTSATPVTRESVAWPHPGILLTLQQKLDEIGVRWNVSNPEDLGLAATMGAELGIVEAHRDGVHFRHSIIQAYLGCRYLPQALEDDDYATQALEDPGPGRELLIALVLGSRTSEGDDQRRALLASGGACHRLRRAAEHADSAKALAVYAAVLEIESAAERPDQRSLVREIANQWPRISDTAAGLDRTLEEAKLRVVRHLGAAARLVAARHPDILVAGSDGDRMDGGDPAGYAAFYDLACIERYYTVRLAAAREIGIGGNEAVIALRHLDEESPYLAGNGNRAGTREEARQPTEESWHEAQVRAWLAAPLCYSARPDPRLSPPETAVWKAQQHLQRWLDRLAGHAPEPGSRLPISLEIALAEGFKLAANVRDHPTQSRAQQRAFLIEKTEYTLKHSRFWYAQLTLIQALTLWSLPDDPSSALPRQGHGSDPRGLVDYWLAVAGNEQKTTGGGRTDRHPFVVEAAELCALALRTCRPEQFCWIDEVAVTTRIGSYHGSRSSQRAQRSWIPDSMGWYVLHPRAQQLVADVLLMLNLAERGERLDELDERLERANRPDLPPCVTTDRSPLDPGRSIGSARISEPGSNCLDDCPFRLCPYPPKGKRLHRAQLSEAFCGQQVALLGPWYRSRPRAAWQELPRRDLENFWRGMMRRTQPGWRRPP